MPLDRKQRERLREQVKPLVTDLVRDQVEREVGKLTSKAPGESDYADLILNSTRRHGKGDLPHGVQIFAKLGIAQTMPDSGMARDAARTMGVEDEYSKALSAGQAEGGGLLLQDDQATEVIEYLRPFSVMRRIGARSVDIPRGTMRTPRIDVGATSGYVGEGQAIPASDIQTGAVTLTAKKLATLVVLSNELARFSIDDPQIDQIVLNEMLASMGQTEDVAFLRGSGTEAEPQGIVNQVAAANKFDANATVNLTNVVSDLRQAMTNLLNNDVPMQNPVWIWSPRTSLFLKTLLDTNGQFAFRDEIERGRLFQWPFFQTNNIPNDLGAGNDESLVIAADAQEVMVGDVAQIGIDRSTQATVTLNGVLTSLFETDRAAVRTRSWNDIRLRHNVGVSVIEAVTWGAGA